MPQKEYFGYGSIAGLRHILTELKTKKIFLITGKKSYELSGAKSSVEQEFISANCQSVHFSDFSPNPKIEEINSGFELFQKEHFDAILAVGGGSCIDVAKSIKLFYFRKTANKIPLIAVPTTSGSGSEATYFIVYYIGKEKQSEGKPDITLPDYVILDPTFTLTLPKSITASTGMDALSQAMESYWCIYSTDESKKLARESMELTIKSLENAVNNPDKVSRENMMKSSNLAGKAINITKTTAPHSIAYPITSYFGIPHGHAAGLTLGEMLVYNFNVSEENCSDKRGAEYVKKTIKEIISILEAKNKEEARQKIKTLMESINLKTRLSDLGLQEEDLNTIIQKGFNPERVKNNPRLLTEENLREILKNIM